MKLQIVIAILWWVHITQALKHASAHWIECEHSEQPSGPLWDSIRCSAIVFRRLIRNWREPLGRIGHLDHQGKAMICWKYDLCGSKTTIVLKLNQLFPYCSSGEKSNQSTDQSVLLDKGLISSILANWFNFPHSKAVNMILDFDTLMFKVILKALARFH